VTGNNFTYTDASGYIHVAELTNLISDTTYYFICGGPIGNYSNERSFRTAPSVSSDVTFVVGGDSRTNEIERETVSQAMAKFNPAFVIHSGDMVENGRYQSLWESWFTDVHTHWIGNNGLTIPIFPTMGNHEQTNYIDTKYYVQFALPGNEMWFSYDWGPDIHIIELNSETAISGSQTSWLENDLINHSQFKWKFVNFHHPPFPVSRIPDDITNDIRTYWVPLFDKYHVDIVFSGHDHAYLRSVPINWTASQTQAQPYENATIYVIAGGWGAPLYALYTNWYDAYTAKMYHFCVVDVFKNGSLHFQTKDDQGNTFDEAWIIKNQSLSLPQVSINFTSPSIHKTLPITLTWQTTGIIDHYNIFIDGQFKKYLPSVVKSYQITSLIEGNHTFTIMAVDPLGTITNASMTLSYDLTPPTTADDYDNQWYKSDYTINLTALDNLNGIGETYYRINDGALRNIKGNGQPVFTTESANNKLEYWSVDLANNEEIPHNILTGIKLDKTPPVSNPKSNITIEVGTSLNFNGSKSTDNVGIKNYTWTFTDITPQIFNEITFSYIFYNLGIFKVTLNISDFASWWAANNSWVTVVDSIPPVANFSFTQSPTSKNIVFFNASLSIDNLRIDRYTWDFGDDNVTSSVDPCISHTYLIPGTYIVNLTVTDEVNNNATYSVTILIEENQLVFPWWIIGVIILEIVLFTSIIVWNNKQKNANKSKL
jgi:hypothetical protein